MHPPLILVPNPTNKPAIINKMYELEIVTLICWLVNTVKIGAKVLWLQLGIKSERAKEIVELNNIEYVHDRCTKMEYQKFFLKMRQAFPVLQS